MAAGSGFFFVVVFPNLYEVAHHLTTCFGPVMAAERSRPRVALLSIALKRTFIMTLVIIMLQMAISEMGEIAKVVVIYSS